MTYETLEVQLARNVGTIRLARPEALNALNLTMARELFQAALALDEDPQVRCIVLTGLGRAFCAGGDVREFHEQRERLPAHLKEITFYFHGAEARLLRARKPLVVGVNGTAAGGGFSLALTGDLVLCAASAKLSMAYARLGAAPDGASTYLLPRLCGIRRAHELFYTNRTLDAEEALAWGLVNRVEPDDRFAEALQGLAQELADGPTEAFALGRALFHRSTHESLETQLALETDAISASGGTADFREAVLAFMDKRPARFTGR